MVITTSALGRSSGLQSINPQPTEIFPLARIYRRVGHTFTCRTRFFKELRDYLRRRNHHYVNGHRFGDGPNWRLRTIRAAFDMLGFKADMLKHGIGREVFVCELQHQKS